jgi:type II secretory pathway pseudopilin PulG
MFRIKRIKINKSEPGFTLIETIVYLFITCALLMVISSLVVNILDARKRIKASNEIQNNARFILNFFNNNIHNVDLLEDINPDPAQLYFYFLPATRFTLTTEDNNLVYRETKKTGGLWPDPSTATPLILNTSRVRVSNFTLIPVNDNQGNLNRGVSINFTLTIGQPADKFGYFQEDFGTFMSLR